MKTSQSIFLLVLLLSVLTFVSATSEPLLVSVTDSLGNIQTNSWANGTGGDWKPELRSSSNNLHCSNCIIQIGDKITFTMNANQEGLEYRCYEGAIGKMITEWSASNTCDWIVSKEDYGQRAYIMVSIRNGNGLDYMGGENGDDYTYMTYKVEENNTPILEDYSNCNIKVENYCPNAQECVDAHINDCSCGSYKNAWCPEGIKVIERLGNQNSSGSTSAGGAEQSCNFTKTDGTTFTQNSVPKNLNGIYEYTCELYNIEDGSFIRRFAGMGNFSFCEADHIKRGIWITNDSICNSGSSENEIEKVKKQLNETQQQVSDLSGQINQTQAEVINLNSQVEKQETILQKIVSFLKSLFGFE